MVRGLSVNLRVASGEVSEAPEIVLEIILEIVLEIVLQIVLEL